MKNSTTCPKCQGSKILYIPGRNANMNVANLIMTGMFSYVPVDRYVCEGCGFVEEWITTPGDVEKLKQKYSRI